jgi:hypothetical protein
MTAQIDLVEVEPLDNPAITGHQDCPRLPRPCRSTTGGRPGLGNSVNAMSIPPDATVCSCPFACGLLAMLAPDSVSR